jgi:F-type H+-transporting ATPase subunit b
MHFDATFWVGIAFIAFVALLVWKGVHRVIIAGLDKRAVSIREQIEEARVLREEAQALLAQHQREQRDADKTAKEILEQADREAKLALKTAQEEMEQSADRRMALAQEKIAQAEAAAVKEVQSVAARVATAAARQLLADKLSADKRAELVDNAISEVDKRVH